MSADANLNPKQQNPRAGRRLVLAVALLATALCYAWATLLAPPNMDEAIHFSIIACEHYENAVYNTFREPCDGFYDLTLLERWRLPLRAYHYAGSLGAILYYPVFLLWPSYHSYQAFYLLFFIVNTLLMARLLRMPFAPALLLSAVSFPLFFQHIHDTGPVFFQLFAFLFTPWLLIKSRHAPPLKTAAYVVAAGLSVFLAIEIKPIFLILLPPFCLFCYWALRFNGMPMGMILSRLAMALMVAAVPTAILLFATIPTGDYYYQLLADAGAGNRNMGYSARQLFNHIASLNNFADRVFAQTDPLAALRAFARNPLGNLAQQPQAATAGLVLSLIYYLCHGYLLKRYVATNGRVDRQRLLHAITLVGIAAATTAILVIQGRVNFGHHFIFVFFILHLSLLLAARDLYAANARRFLAVAAVLIALNIGFIGVNHATGVHRHTAAERLAILRDVLTEEREERGIIIHLSWGLYYLDALYGSPRQTTLFIFDRRNEKTMFADALRLARRQGKDIYLLYSDPSAPTVRNVMRVIKQHGLPDPTPLRRGDWNADLLPHSAIRAALD